ncbi:MAG: hypothetical protein WKF73_14985 [Nocardioidaceae bacterium]
MRGPLVVLAVACVGGGWLVMRPGFLGVEADHVHVRLMLVSTTLALLGAAVTVAGRGAHWAHPIQPCDYADCDPS